MKLCALNLFESNKHEMEKYKYTFFFFFWWILYNNIFKSNVPRRFRSLDPGTCTDARVSKPCRVGRRIPEFLGLCCRSCIQTRCHSLRGIRLADETLPPDRRSPNLSKECWASRFLAAMSRFSPGNSNAYTFLIYIIPIKDLSPVIA